MSKDRYVYPAVFHYADDGISIEFPDLPGCLTCGNTTEEALLMAKEALELHLFGMEQDGDIIPPPSELTNIKLESNERLILIDVFMPAVRDEQQNRAIKKTLTIPKWLNDVAEKQNVNFSQILQSGLKQHLGMYNHRHFDIFKATRLRNQRHIPKSEINRPTNP
jgi:predicted RNase H-like HicB family nuclease